MIATGLYGVTASSSTMKVRRKRERIVWCFSDAKPEKINAIFACLKNRT